VSTRADWLPCPAPALRSGTSARPPCSSGLTPGGRFDDWLAAALVTVTFAVSWLTFRQRARKRGARYRRGFGLAAVIGLIIILPPTAIAVFFAGPFAVFGPGLLTAGIALHNRFLAWWGGLVGAVGILEGYFGITNRMTISLWAEWEHPAIFLSLGVLTVTAGVIALWRENRAQGSQVTVAAAA